MKKIASILILAAASMAVMAVPARRDGFVRIGADGTEKMVWQHGNEDFHYMTDAEGNWLDEETLVPLTEAQKSERLQMKERAIRKAAQQQMTAIPLNVAPRGLIILVNFQNMAFVTPYDTMNNMMNGTNFTRHFDYSYDYSGRHYEGTVNSSGSARQYFIDQSYGQYQPVFDVVGPYTVSQNYEYYGKNTSSGGISSAVGTMIKEACQLADQNGTDFTLYDNNNDGKVDFVYVIYAGEGEADGGGANTIWPHAYSLSGWGISCIVDGKTVTNYACSNEMNHYAGVYSGIGTFVHEFSHVIGLPDLYATNDANHKTCGQWDILDYGPYNNEGNTPPGYTAYERFFCGWLTPRVLSQAENTTLQTIDNQEALLLCSGDTHNLVGNDPNPTTFYLLEARTQTGWDEFIPGEGMMITKISYNYNTWYMNEVNNSANSMGVDILEADGKAPSYVKGLDNGYKGKTTDLFPAGATEWTAFANHEITEITKDADGTIHFKYRGGSTTEIENIQNSETSVQKILKDGRVYILRGGKTYDILGHENHQL